MKEYRKFIEPEYGEVSPEVNIGKPQVLDLEHPDRWRRRSNLESVAAMTDAIMRCNCYEDVMALDAEDITVLNGNYRVPVRIYYPDDKKQHPVLIFIHGGGFEYNNIDVYEYVNRYLSLKGKMVVVSPDYRLAPEYTFPIGLNDCYAVLKWVCQHADSIHGLTNNICVGGDSAGGNFTAALTLKARNEGTPEIAKQILVYPCVIQKADHLSTSEIRYGHGYFLEINGCEGIKEYFNELEDMKNPLASPLLEEDLTNLPPACFISAECDPLLDQGLQYAARLFDSGISVEYHIMKGMIHGFLNSTYEKSFEALNYIAAFVNQ